MSDKRITESMLDELRAELEKNKNDGRMSPKRYVHTIEVEKMAVRLGEIFAPDKLNILRAAALLHDITKEYLPDVHLKIFAEHCVDLSETDYYATKTFHARTAALLIPLEYPEIADKEVVECVRWHTTGKAGMSICEKIVYLADYIDMSRMFDDCVRLRKYFFSADIESMSESEREAHLDDTLLISFDMTISGLLESRAPISPDTLAARNELAIKAIKRR